MEKSSSCLRNMFLVLSKPKNGVKVVYFHVIYGMMRITPFSRVHAVYVLT